ncbi:MAG: polysaccharide deacetylase family protein [Clostridia bacterium]|nr:polysaccharide deacetylase family protein [Clostridiales bacterium]
MKKTIIILIIATIACAGFITALRFFNEAGEVLSGTRFNWYESKTQNEIENGNKFAQERLSKKYHVFVNGIFVDIGYDWDGIIYVPIRTISDSLNWIVNWVPDLGMIQLVKDNQEAFVDIVNFFGKGYVPLDRLENLLSLDNVQIHGGNIEIHKGSGIKQSIDIRKLPRFSFYINGMKMTDNAVGYQGEKLVPSRIFALSFGKVFKYDAIEGHSYINDSRIDAVFIGGSAYSTLDQLKEAVNTEGTSFQFREFTPDTQPLRPVIDKGPEEKVVALTFDDYIGDKVYPLLDVLDECNVKASFFIIGNSIEQNAGVLEELTKRGHQAANHTWDHYNNHTLTDDEIRAQLISTRLFTEKYGGKSALFFRPPGGYYNDNMVRIAQNVGLQTVLWSLNSTDADPQNDAKHIRRVVTQWVHPGAIVTMHTGRDATIEALPGIVENLRDRGYRFVTISEMVKLKGGD